MSLMCIIFIFVFLIMSCVNAEFYEDSRCSCVCPSISNGGNILRTFYQDNHISPEQCNCKDMVLPKIGSKINGSLLTFCIQCDCRFETRNTTVVLIVVTLLCVTIALLVLYMLCIKLLQRIVKRRKNVPYRKEDGKELDVLLNDTHHDSSDEAI